jgi:hypothetical protein
MLLCGNSAVPQNATASVPATVAECHKGVLSPHAMQDARAGIHVRLAQRTSRFA